MFQQRRDQYHDKMLQKYEQALCNTDWFLNFLKYF